MEKDELILLAREKLKKFKQKSMQRSPERNVNGSGNGEQVVTNQLRALKDKLSEITSSVLQEDPTRLDSNDKIMMPVSVRDLETTPFIDENSIATSVRNLKLMVDSKQTLIEQLLEQKREVSASLLEHQKELEKLKNSTVLDLQAENRNLHSQLEEMKAEKTLLSKKLSHLQASQMTQLPSLEKENEKLKNEILAIRELNVSLAKENKSLKKTKEQSTLFHQESQTNSVPSSPVTKHPQSGWSLPANDTTTKVNLSVSTPTAVLNIPPLAGAELSEAAIQTDTQSPASPLPYKSSGSQEFKLMEQIQKEWQEERDINVRLRARIQELSQAIGASANDDPLLISESPLAKVMEDGKLRYLEEQVSLLENRLMQLIDEKASIMNNLEDEKRRCNLLSEQTDTVIPEMIIRYHAERRKLQEKAFFLEQHFQKQSLQKTNLSNSPSSNNVADSLESIEVATPVANLE